MSAQYKKQLAWVQGTLEGLNKINFADINMELEQKRQEISQGLQRMAVLINAPLLFSSTYKIMKKQYDEFVELMNHIMFTSQQ